MGGVRLCAHLTYLRGADSRTPLIHGGPATPASCAGGGGGKAGPASVVHSSWRRGVDPGGGAGEAIHGGDRRRRDMLWRPGEGGYRLSWRCWRRRWATTGTRRPPRCVPAAVLSWTRRPPRCVPAAVLSWARRPPRCVPAAVLSWARRPPRCVPAAVLSWARRPPRCVAAAVDKGVTAPPGAFDCGGAVWGAACLTTMV